MTLVLFMSMIISISGQITDQTTKSVEQQLRRHEGGRISLVINSGGGSVDEGAKIARLLKATNKPVDCLVLGTAKSMAFTLLTFCDTRYALQSSSFLVHDIRIHYERVVLTEKEMEQDLAELRAANIWQRSLLTKSLGRYKEGSWSSLQLLKEFPGWLIVVEDVQIIETRSKL